MTFRPLLTLGAVALIAALGVPVMAQAPHSVASNKAPAQSAPAKSSPGKSAPAKVQPAKPQPARAPSAKGHASGPAHQKACRNRYKSYDARSDSYLYRGKRIRCTL